MSKDLDYLAKNFVYKRDGKLDNWQIMPLDKLEGDCDDYAVTALYLACDKSLVKFWWSILTFQAIFWHTLSPKGNGHLVLCYKNRYIDNWQKTWVTKDTLTYKGYVFKFPWIFPFCGIKMLIGVLVRRKNGA